VHSPLVDPVEIFYLSWWSGYLRYSRYGVRPYHGIVHYQIILYNYYNTYFTKSMDNEYKLPTKIIHNMAGILVEVNLFNIL